jgi:hypothetical protein
MTRIALLVSQEHVMKHGGLEFGFLRPAVDPIAEADDALKIVLHDHGQTTLPGHDHEVMAWTRVSPGVQARMFRDITVLTVRSIVETALCGADTAWPGDLG